MPHYDYKKDKPIANATEMQVVEHLINTQAMGFIHSNNNSRYDLAMRTRHNRDITIEVKEDFTCARTGNVGVEFESWGRAAGIGVSEADYYLFKVHRPDGKIQVLMQKTETLKEMIVNRNYTRIVTGGDPGSYSKNYLFPLEVFQEKFMKFGFLPN